MGEAKFMGILKMSDEERKALGSEEDIKDAFRDARSQAEVDIRETAGKIRKYKASIRDLEKNTKSFRIHNVAEYTLQLKAEEEFLAEMKNQYKEYFGKEYSEEE